MYRGAENSARYHPTSAEIICPLASYNALTFYAVTRLPLYTRRLSGQQLRRELYIIIVVPACTNRRLSDNRIIIFFCFTVFPGTI